MATEARSQQKAQKVSNVKLDAHKTSLDEHPELPVGEGINDGVEGETEDV